jgi:hypothetical protein
MSEPSNSPDATTSSAESGILDFGRLRGTAIVLMSIAVAMGMYGLILTASIGRQNPTLLLRDQTFSVSNSIDVGTERALGILRDPPQQPQTRLGVMFGSSTLRQGVDPAILESELGGSYRWSNLRASGHAHEFKVLLQLMFKKGLRPDALILVVNPGIIVADANLQEERVWYNPALLVDHVRKRQLEEARTDLIELSLVPLHAAFPHRGQIFTVVDRALFSGKLRVLNSFGLGLESLAAPDSRPWEEEFPVVGPRATREANANILKAIGVKGWYDPARYRADGPNFADLAEIFLLGHANEARCFVVFVPESAVYRAKLPSDAAYHFTNTLRTTLGDAAPVVLDFRDAAPDEDFHDVNHLNRDGRLHFSKRLARAIKPYLQN